MRRSLCLLLILVSVILSFTGLAWAQTEESAEAEAASEAATEVEAAPVIPRPTPEPKVTESVPAGTGPRLPQRKVRRVVKKIKRVENLWGLGLTTFDTDYKVQVRTIETQLKGSQLGFMGFWDRYLRGHFKARFSGAIDSVNNEGTIVSPPGCGGKTTCSLKLMLLHVQGEVWVGLFNYEKSGVNFGVSGGVTGLLPLTKSSDAIETTNMAGTAGLTGGGFFEVRLTDGYWVWAQYQMLRFAKSESVNLEASRASLGVSFEL